MTRLRVLGTLFALSLLALPNPAEAVPLLVTYTGRLMDASGEPLAGEYDIRVGLFDEQAPEDTSAVWEAYWEDSLPVVINDGYFSVVLGSHQALLADDLTADEIYVSFRLDSGEDWFRPGSPLTSTPFAIRAAVADRAEEADLALRVEGEVAATSIETLDGVELVDTSGTWVGPIDSPYTANVLELEINGQPAFNSQRQWEGPALDLPEGSSVEGEPILTGSTLEAEIDQQITSYIGTTADDNPLNHDRYTVADLLTYLNAGLPWPDGSDQEKLFHTPTGADDLVADLSTDFVLKVGDDVKTGELVVDGTLDVRGEAANPSQGIVEDPADLNFSNSAVNPALWSIRTDGEDLTLVEPNDTGTPGKEHLRVEDGGDIRLSPDGSETVVLSPEVTTFYAENALGASSEVLAVEDDQVRFFPGVGNNADVLNVTTDNIVATVGTNEIEVLNAAEDETTLRATGTQGTAEVQLLGTNSGLGATEIVLDAAQITTTGDLSIGGDLLVSNFQLSGGLDVPGTLEVDEDQNGQNELEVDSSGMTVTVPATFSSNLYATTIDTPSGTPTMTVGATNATGVQFGAQLSGGSGSTLQVDSNGLSVAGNTLVGGTLYGATTTTAPTLNGADVDGNLTADTTGDGVNDLSVTATAMTVSLPTTFSGDLFANSIEPSSTTLTIGGNVNTDTVVFDATLEGPSGGDLQLSQGLVVTGDVEVGGQLGHTTPGSPVQVDSDGLTVTGGGVTVSAGGLDVTGDADFADDLYIDGTLHGATSLGVATQLLVGSTGLSSGGQLAVTSGGLDITGGASFADDVQFTDDVTLTGNGDDLTVKGAILVNSTQTFTAGDVNDDGAVSARQFLRTGACPFGYSALTGTNNQACISSTAETAKDWDVAWTTCLSEGAVLCSETQLALADQLGTVSELDPASGNEEFWSDCQFQDGSSDADKMCEYDAHSGGDDADDIEPEDLSNSVSRRFYCCIFP